MSSQSPANQPANQPSYSPPSQPGYPPAPVPGGVPVYTPLPIINSLAVMTFIFMFLNPIAGIVTGHVSLSQIALNGERGKTLAVISLVICYLSVIGFILMWVFLGTVIMSALQQLGNIPIR